MPLALILSSHVAGSRVGGSAQALALAPFGVDPVVVPTVLFGRHPGWGAPGGAAVEDATFAGMLEGLEAHRTFNLADLLITGYFASAGQVVLAAGAIDKARGATDRTGAWSGRCLAVVDPIMGDDAAGLYVKPQVADAVTRDLVPRADWLTPNAWELARLAGRPVASAADAVAAARGLEKPVLVTSIPAGEGRIGLALVTADRAVLYSHPRLDKVPHGTGDLVTALFAAGLIREGDPFRAAEGAARAAAEIVAAAVEWDAFELPIVALGERLVRPSAQVGVEEIA
jgi:pyridoxine kinase